MVLEPTFQNKLALDKLIIQRTRELSRIEDKIVTTEFWLGKYIDDRIKIREELNILNRRVQKLNEFTKSQGH